MQQVLKLLHGPDRDVCTTAEPGDKPALNVTFTSFLCARCMAAVHTATAGIDPFESASLSSSAAPGGAAAAAADDATPPDDDATGPSSGAGGEDEEQTYTAVSATSFAGAMARDDRYYSHDVLMRCSEALSKPGTAAACKGYTTDLAAS